MKYIDIIDHAEVLEYYHRGNQIPGSLGYTDHSTGVAAEPIAAALIIADKSDVRPCGGSSWSGIQPVRERSTCVVARLATFAHIH